MSLSYEKRRVDVVLFHGFELLDVFGPLELYGKLLERFEISLVGPERGPVRSAQGPDVLAYAGYSEARLPDIVLVPGGIGTRNLVLDQSFLDWLRAWAKDATILSSVCTGSGLIAAAGLLDGYQATSNKRAFDWAVQQGPHVSWVRQARWTHDGSRWTSSGVAAGVDMTLAIIASICGQDTAEQLAVMVEYEWHRDPHWDPFAFT